MLPSITTKFFVPLVFTPMTRLTRQQVLAISDLPGSMIRLRSRERTSSRTYSNNPKWKYIFFLSVTQNENINWPFVAWSNNCQFWKFSLWPYSTRKLGLNQHLSIIFNPSWKEIPKFHPISETFQIKLS